MANRVLASNFIPSNPISGSIVHQRKSSMSMRTYAMRKEADYDGQNDYSGKLVDQNLIILRKRIHEMKMIEKSFEAPAEWMDWEKSFYTSYNSMVCEVTGILQSVLMHTRPSLAIGMIALFILSVPTSTLMAVLYLMELGKGILASIHLG